MAFCFHLKWFWTQRNSQSNWIEIFNENLFQEFGLKTETQQKASHRMIFQKKKTIIIMIILSSFGKYMNHEQNLIFIYVFSRIFPNLKLPFDVSFANYGKLKNVKLNDSLFFERWQNHIVPCIINICNLKVKLSVEHTSRTFWIIISYF